VIEPGTSSLGSSRLPFVQRQIKHLERVYTGLMRHCWQVLQLSRLAVSEQRGFLELRTAPQPCDYNPKHHEYKLISKESSQ
jgi:hypothetical protein